MRAKDNRAPVCHHHSTEGRRKAGKEQELAGGTERPAVALRQSGHRTKRGV